MADTAPDQHAHAPPSDAGRIVYPFTPPAPDASVVEVAPGILWLRMPMPMQLDHINIYLLRDGDNGGDGWIIVDTGLNTPACKALWEEVVATRLDGLPLKGLVCTHFHYDHAGLARWLTDRYAIPLWMTHGEFYTMRALGERLPEPPPEGLVLFHQRAGMPEERIAHMLAGLRKDPFMPPQPESFRRLRAGDRLTIGGRSWQIIVGEGHSPEHACLYCAEDAILIAGDQLLPRITSNVLVSSMEPEGNPLQLWLDSLERLDRLSPDTLVLPSHERVFRGLRPRVAELQAHHQHQFDLLLAALAGGVRLSAFEAMGVLFPRSLRPTEEMMAVGESLAHLAWLRYAGRLVRSLDEDGVYRFAVAA